MYLLLLALLPGLLLPACTPDDKAPAGVDRDKDGYDADVDCDDDNAAVNPGAEEACDGIDNDCDGGTDDAGEGVGAWYADVDADGYGNLDAGVLACDQPPGTVADSTDCDDAQPLSFPGNQEVCDEIDNDCDGAVDDGATDIIQSFPDEDGDGYGDWDVDELGCTIPDGWVTSAGDCDDTDPAVYMWATETCGDGIDQDCDGADTPCG